MVGNRKNKCNICGKYFKEKGNLVTHKKIHVDFINIRLASAHLSVIFQIAKSPS
jgi:hypothetical protein